MMRSVFQILFLFASGFLHASEDCLTVHGIANLDAAYEQSLVDRSVDFLEQTLHEDFVWVHNHAALIQDSKAAYLQNLRKAKKSGMPGASTKRKSTGTRILLEENTAVIYGFVDVERTDAYVTQTGKPRKIRFHFMRTYVRTDGGCRLLANQTMEVWREGQPDPKGE